MENTGAKTGFAINCSRLTAKKELSMKARFLEEGE